MLLSLIELFKKNSISIALLSIGASTYALPFGINEASFSTGVARSKFEEVFDSPMGSYPSFKIDILNPYIATSIEKKFFNNRCSILTEASYIYSNGQDITLEHNRAPYYTHTQLWDVKSFIFGPTATNQHIKFGIGIGYGRAAYVFHAQSGNKIRVNRSHGILPLLALNIGNQKKNSYEISLQYGMNTMSESDYGYAPYIESSISYFFKSTSELSEGFRIKYVNWKNPILVISPIKNTPSQKSLFFGYEVRFQ